VAKEALANEKLQQMLQDQREAEKSKDRTVSLQKEVRARAPLTRLMKLFHSWAYPARILVLSDAFTSEQNSSTAVLLV
jgi:hypothetical protein